MRAAKIWRGGVWRCGDAMNRTKVHGRVSTRAAHPRFF